MTRWSYQGIHLTAAEVAVWKAGLIIVVTVGLVSFGAGHMYSNSVFWRAYQSCTETVTARYMAKIMEEFELAESKLKAKHNALPRPLSHPVLRVYDPPEYERYFELVAPTRSDYAEYTKSRDDCVRTAAAK